MGSDYRIVRTYLTGRPPNPAALVTLLCLGAIVCMSLLFWENWFGLSEFLPVSKPSLYENGEMWRAWTAIFIHADVGHLLSNSLFFVLFGYLIYAYFGAILFPWGTLIGAVITNYITVAYYPPFVRLLGASGWVYVLAGTWLALFVLIERRLTITGRIVRFIGVSLVLLIPETFKAEVSYLSHGAGFAVGLLIGLGYFMVNKEWIRKYEVFKYWEPDPEGGGEVDPIGSEGPQRILTGQSH